MRVEVLMPLNLKIFGRHFFKKRILILVVFAFTGTTILFIKDPILNVIVGEDEKNWLHSLIYFILILPIYNVFLLIYGFLFGQFNFFWEYEKKFFQRIFRRGQDPRTKMES